MSASTGAEGYSGIFSALYLSSDEESEKEPAAVSSYRLDSTKTYQFTHVPFKEISSSCGGKRSFRYPSPQPLPRGIFSKDGSSLSSIASSKEARAYHSALMELSQWPNFDHKVHSFPRKPELNPLAQSVNQFNRDFTTPLTAFNLNSPSQVGNGSPVTHKKLDEASRQLVQLAQQHIAQLPSLLEEDTHFTVYEPPSPSETRAPRGHGRGSGRSRGGTRGGFGASRGRGSGRSQGTSQASAREGRYSATSSLYSAEGKKPSFAW